VPTVLLRTLAMQLVVRSWSVRASVNAPWR